MRELQAMKECVYRENLIEQPGTGSECSIDVNVVSFSNQSKALLRCINYDLVSISIFSQEEVFPSQSLCGKRYSIGRSSTIFQVRVKSSPLAHHSQSWSISSLQHAVTCTPCLLLLLLSSLHLPWGQTLLTLNMTLTLNIAFRHSTSFQQSVHWVLYRHCTCLPQSHWVLYHFLQCKYASIFQFATFYKISLCDICSNC